MVFMRLALYVGAGYFLLVAIAHAFGVKIPGLYVYFDVPSYVYQDKIISFLAFGWAACFFSAAQSLSKSLIGALLVSGFVAIGMLLWINVSTDLVVFGTDINRFWFGFEVAGLFLYGILLLLLYLRIRC